MDVCEPLPTAMSRDCVLPKAATRFSAGITCHAEESITCHHGLTLIHFSAQLEPF